MFEHSVYTNMIRYIAGIAKSVAVPPVRDKSKE